MKDEVLSTYPQNIVCQIPKRAHNVEVERYLGSGHCQSLISLVRCKDNATIAALGVIFIAVSAAS